MLTDIHMYIQDSLYVIKQIAISKQSILIIYDHFIVILYFQRIKYNINNIHMDL